MSNNDLISREYLEDAFDNLCCHNCKTCRNFKIENSFYKCALIDNAPTVEIPQGEWVEVKHRLNLLIGVLYSNQLISHDDIEYIEDSIKKLMKDGNK